MDNSKNIEGRKQARLRGIALATVAFVSAATGTAVAQAAPQVISQPGTISDKAADEKFVQATKSDDKRASKPKVISQPGTVSETQQESNADVVEETTQKETEKPQAKVISQPGVIVREGGDEGAGNVISQPGTTKVQENETPKPERDEREPQNEAPKPERDEREPQNEAPKPERDEREPQNEAPKYNDSQVREPRYVQVDDTKNSVVKPVTNGNAAANNVSQGQAASTKQNEAELTTRDTARAATATKKPVTEATDKADQAATATKKPVTEATDKADQAATATKKPVTEATDKADADEEATVIELGLAGEGEGGVTVTEDEAGTATKGQWSTPINAGDIDTTITHPDQDGIVTATDEATGKEVAWDASVSIAADDAVDNVAQAAGLGGEKKTPVQEATEVLPSESAVNVGGVEVQTEVSQQQSEAVQAETAQPVTEDTTDEAVQAETAQPVTEDTTDEAVQAETDTDSGVESASETTE